MKWWLAFLIFGVAQGLVRPRVAESEDRAALAAQFPGALQTVVYGAFQPGLAQWLWYEYGAARAEGRVLDAVRTLRVLARVEPENPRAVLYLAHVLAHDMAEREATPVGRAERIVEALRVLEESERSGPRSVDPHLPGARAVLLRGVMNEQPNVIRNIARRLGASPLAAAYAAFLRTLELAPGSLNVRLNVLDCGRERALELFLVERNPNAAVDLLGEALALVDPITRRGAPLVVALASSWRRVLACVEPPRRDQLPAALDGLARTLSELPEGPLEGPDSESAWVAAALPRLLESVEAARPSEPEFALSALEALRRIQAVSAPRWALSSPPVAPDARYLQRWQAILAALEKDLPDRVAAISALMPPW